MKYRSKVDWWYYIIIMLFTYCTVHVVYCFFTNNSSKEHPLLLVLFLLCEFLFLLPNLFLTYYIFEESCMYIRSGYFLWKNIEYTDIVKIRETKSLFSPSGLSMERIEITYKYKDSINAALMLYTEGGNDTVLAPTWHESIIKFQNAEKKIIKYKGSQGTPITEAPIEQQKQFLKEYQDFDKTLGAVKT